MFAIITVWLNHSGKSYFAKILAESNEKFIMIESDPFRSMIRHNHNLKQLHEQSKNTKDWNLIINYILLTQEFISKSHYYPILATCNWVKDKRLNLIQSLQSSWHQVIVVYCNPWEDIIKQRLLWAKLTKDPILFSHWLEKNLERMMSFFEAPEHNEWNYYFEINNDLSLNQTIMQINQITNTINE